NDDATTCRRAVCGSNPAIRGSNVTRNAIDFQREAFAEGPSLHAKVSTLESAVATAQADVVAAKTALAAANAELSKERQDVAAWCTKYTASQTRLMELEADTAAARAWVEKQVSKAVHDGWMAEGEREFYGSLKPHLAAALIAFRQPSTAPSAVAPAAAAAAAAPVPLAAAPGQIPRHVERLA